MREILFKGKRKDNGEWVEGFYYESLISGCYILVPKLKTRRKDGVIIGDSFDVYEVDPETVCQYTGLKDMNGKKIFEGDIIKYADRLDYECYMESLENPEEYEGCNYSDIFITDEVVYGIEYDYPAFDLKRHFCEYNVLSELNNGDWYFEVIGNIFDNPELLEVTE